MSKLISHARVFCRAAHQAVAQKRKYTGEPYYHHPIAVADLVRAYGGTENMIVAALLHDVLEDTQVSMLDIAQTFNNHVMTLVYELTDQFTAPHYGSRAYRKQLEAGRLGLVSAEAQTIKYADLIHNTQSISQHAPDFARVYLPEKRVLLDKMDKGHPTLRAQAYRYLEDAEALLQTPA